jgi:tetratricopeptide (TPR) repeat protein
MSAPDLEQRVEEIEALPYGVERTQLARRLVDDADAVNNLDLAYRARYVFAQSANFSGEKDASLVAIAWMVEQHDRDPNLGDLHWLLWLYKWVLTALPSLPNMTPAKVSNALEDFARRCRASGYGDQAVAKLRWQTAWLLGDDQTDQLFRSWHETPRDRLSDCAACDASEAAEWLIERERDSAALEIVEPVLQGRLSCAEEPHRTYAHVLAPLRRRDELDQAHALHRRGYRMILSNPAFLVHVSLHIEHLAVTGNILRAAEIANRHRGWAEQARIPADRLSYLRAVAVLLTAATARSLDRLTLSLPGAAEATSNVSENLVSVVGQAEAIARMYDARNNSNRETWRLSAVLASASRIVDAPLPSVVRALSVTEIEPREEASAPASQSPAAVPTDLASDQLLEWANEQYQAGNSEAALRAFEMLRGRAQSDGDEAGEIGYLRRLGNTLASLGRTEEAEAALLEVCERGSALGLDEQVARADATLGQLALQRGDTEQGRRRLLNALSIPPSDEPGSQTSRGWASALIAVNDLDAGHGEDARHRFAQAVELLLDDADAGAESRLMWASALARAGSFAEALAKADEVIDLQSVVSERRRSQMVGHAHYLRAQLLQELRRPADAAEAWLAYRSALAVADVMERANAMGRAAYQSLLSGDHGRSAHMARTAIEEAEAAEPRIAVEPRTTLIRALASGDQLDVAADLVEDTLNAVSDDVDRVQLGWLRRLGGDIAVDTGEYQLARRYFGDAIEDFKHVDDPVACAAAQERLADLMDGQLGEGKVLYAEAAEAFLANGIQIAAGRCQRKLAGSLLDLNELAEALHASKQAQGLLQAEDPEASWELALAHRIEGYVHLEQGNANAAVESARAAIAAAGLTSDRPLQGHLVSLLASSLHRAGQQDEGIRVLEEAVAEFEGVPEVSERLKRLLASLTQGEAND